MGNVSSDLTSVFSEKTKNTTHLSVIPFAKMGCFYKLEMFSLIENKNSNLLQGISIPFGIEIYFRNLDTSIIEKITPMELITYFSNPIPIILHNRQDIFFRNNEDQPLFISIEWSQKNKKTPQCKLYPYRIFCTVVPGSKKCVYSNAIKGPFSYQLDSLHPDKLSEEKYLKNPCTVCLDAEANMLYDCPYNHITNCQPCSKLLKKCPICQHKINKKIKVNINTG